MPIYKVFVIELSTFKIVNADFPPESYGSNQLAINPGMTTVVKKTEAINSNSSVDVELLNKDITDPSNEITADRLRLVTGEEVDISGSAAPVNGQLLSAGGDGTAVWKSVAGINLDNYNRREISTASATLTSSDLYIGVTATTTTTVTLTLPEISTISGTKKIYYITDEGGNAFLNNITINTAVGDTVNGETSTVINIDYGSLSLYNNETTGWFIY